MNRSVCRWLSVAALLCVSQSLCALWGAEITTVKPKDLAIRLRANGPKPFVIYVGFAVMYRNKHIPGAVYPGAGSRADGLEALKAAVMALPRDREVVLYCGCCPWDMCPNIQPAFALLRKMGFTRLKALLIPTNFAADWLDQGYPTVAGTPAK